MKKTIYPTLYNEESEAVIYALLLLANDVALQLLFLASVKTLLGWVQHTGLGEN